MCANTCTFDERFVQVSQYLTILIYLEYMQYIHLDRTHLGFHIELDEKELVRMVLHHTEHTSEGHVF